MIVKTLHLFLAASLFFSGCSDYVVSKDLISCKTSKACIERAILVSHQGIHCIKDTDALLYRAINLLTEPPITVEKDSPDEKA